VLTNGLTGRKQSPVELAEAAYHLEKMLGVTGGKQDQYAAALGGFNLLRFGAEAELADVEQFDVPPRLARALRERCVLCYSGTPPGAGSLHEQVWERYRGGDARDARQHQAGTRCPPARRSRRAGRHADGEP
jgi:D-glycero-alpha-D-manno-heptose-7-phosphate kinase